MSKLKAVVVEDDVNLGATFKTVLEFCDFEVTYVNNSQLAMENIVAIAPALVLLDLQMPIVSGLDILQSIRAHDQISKTKVIILTASSYALRDENIYNLADLILIKPASVSQIQDFASRLTRSS